MGSVSGKTAKMVRNRRFQRRRQQIERIRRRLQLLRDVADLALEELRERKRR
jgi:hypothetical protein